MVGNLRQTVQREYERMQRESQRRLDARRSEAIAIEPQISTLLSARAAVYTEAYSEALKTGVAPDKALLRKKYAEIDEQIGMKLNAHGLPSDYLKPVYNCPICQDRGYVGDVDRRDCACFIKRMEEERIRQNRLDMAGDDSFDKFDENIFPADLLPGTDYSQRDFMLRVRNISATYCDAYPDNRRRNLIFSGSTGLGKTFLLNCIANRLSEDGAAVCYLTAYRMLSAMRSSVIESQSEAFDIMVDNDVLIIDDLGSEPIYKNITIEMLFTLLNERTRMRRHTIVATNLTTKDIMGRYGDRVASRLLNTADTQIISFMGKDLRTLSRKA